MSTLHAARGPHLSRKEFGRLRTLVQTHTGIALDDSKQQLLTARLGKRLRHFGYDSFDRYYRHLTESDPAGLELVHFINAITTTQTAFFRERHHFAFLRDILMRADRRPPPGREPTFRIWSAGCASGEEAYSIALTALDARPHTARGTVRVLASDINTAALVAARSATYGIEQADQIPRRLRKRFLLRGTGARAGLMRLTREVTALVVFGRRNLLHAAWAVPFDAIFCRNVLIYFDRTLQQRIVGALVRCLKTGGHLFLGHSEALLGMRPDLRACGHTIYQKVE